MQRKKKHSDGGVADGVPGKVEKMGWPPRRLTEEPVEQGQCFHHCRSFFHSPCRRWTEFSFALYLSLLPLSFYAFLPAKDPLSSGCRWVPSAGRYQCLYVARVGGWMSFVKVPSSFPFFAGSSSSSFH